MNHSKRVLTGWIVFLAFTLIVSIGCTKQGEKQATVAQSVEQPEEALVEIPAAVVKAIEDNVPKAEIDKVEIEEKGGIKLYDIEFKANRGEIEVAEDGTVIDIVTIITMNDVPDAAAEALKKAIESATIIRIEKSEVWAEVKIEGDVGKIIKSDSPRYVYEAEIKRDGQTGEVEVAADGSLIEPLKWETK